MQSIKIYTDHLGNDIGIPVLQKDLGAGPHIVLTALNHGSEVIGFNSGLYIYNNFEKLFGAGKLTFITALNPEGFRQNSRFFEYENHNGNGGTNLNRLYNKDSQQFSAQIANKIFSFILGLNPDFVIDLHSYSANSLIHLILDRPGGEIEKKLINLATASKLPFYLEYEAQTLLDQQLDYALSNQLCLQGVLAWTLELGNKESFSMEQENLANQALVQALNTFYNIDNKQELYPELDIAWTQKYNRVSLINDSEFAGYFRPRVRIGQQVQRGDLVSEIVNLRGQVVHQILSPKDGYILVFEDEPQVYPNKEIGLLVSEVSS